MKIEKQLEPKFFSFLVTNGTETSLVRSYGESFEQSKANLAFSLHKTWSVVEDASVISSFIKEVKSEECNAPAHLTRHFDENLAQLERQMTKSQVSWNEDETVCVINNGKNIFKGIIRGMGLEPITYLFNDIRDLDFIVFDEWIYKIKEAV